MAPKERMIACRQAQDNQELIESTIFGKNGPFSKSRAIERLMTMNRLAQIALKLLQLLFKHRRILGF